MEKSTINSVEDIKKVLYKQVDMLVENSKNCEPNELINNTECILNIYSRLMYKDNREVIVEINNSLEEIIKNFEQVLFV